MNYQLLQGDCIEVLQTLPAASVHCCVTSPPYWGLRDYGTATWEGGDPACDHKPGNVSRVGKTTLQGGTATAGHQQEGYHGNCPKCGAVRIDQQIGLEPTVSEYVEKLVAVFREVRRVLRDDGTLWLNLGDTYASAWAVSRRNVVGNGSLENGKRANRPNRLVDGLKEKDLIGVPWSVAFALRADGWWLRSDIIWNKPNTMPDGATDRPTKAHEYLFLLTKQAHYHCDMEAVREPVAGYDRKGGKATYTAGGFHTNGIGSKTFHQMSAVGRNKRSVWTVATKAYPEAHFATYPVELVQPCIMAGCPVDGTVLDPFNGAGTTGVAAIGLGRQYIGIDVSAEYIKLADRRLGNTQPALIAG